MITVKFMKPFYTKVISVNKLRIVFAYQYFSIMKDEEIYHFIPIEGKEIIINLNTRNVENLNEVFVFKKGNRFMRLPLYQLLLVSNVNDYLIPIIEANSKDIQQKEVEGIQEEVQPLIDELEKQNIYRAIDVALATGDEKAFYALASKL